MSDVTRWFTCIALDKQINRDKTKLIHNTFAMNIIIASYYLVDLYKFVIKSISCVKSITHV